METVPRRRQPILIRLSSTIQHNCADHDHSCELVSIKYAHVCQLTFHINSLKQVLQSRFPETLARIEIETRHIPETLAVAAAAATTATAAKDRRRRATLLKEAEVHIATREKVIRAFLDTDPRRKPGVYMRQ